MKNHLCLAAALALSSTACDRSSPSSSNLEAAPVIDLARYEVQRLPDDEVLGAKNPLVTLVLFSDYACEPCGRAWTVAQRLVEHYPDELAVVYRSFRVPGYDSGEIAADAAFAAGAQGKFWEMHRALFLNTDNFSRPSLRLASEKLGLDTEKFFDDLDGGIGTGTKIRHQRQATQFGIRALPVGFVNGLFLMGSPLLSESGMRGLVEAEIGQARRLMQEGTLRKDVYAAFMRGALRKPVIENEDAQELRSKRAALLGDKPAANVPRNGPDRRARYAVPVGAPGRGPAAAPVVAVEFVDFMCPFCQRAETDVVEKLAAEFGDALRIETRQLPLPMHQGADAAARAYLAAARQGKHVEFGAELFDAPAIGRETFLQLARKAGLELGQFTADFDDPALGKQVEADIALARQLGVSGTPAMFVNGRYIDGLQGVGTYAGLVREELSRAEQLTKSGTPRDALRAALMADALPPSKFPNPTLPEEGAGLTATPEASP